MSDVIESPNVKGMDIGQLRHYASHLRLVIPKTATKDDIVKAIEKKLNGRVVPEIAGESSKVKPGYAKIRILSDPMPGASNIPVFLNCNGYTCLIPRDIDVIVPMRVIRTLNDASVKRRKQTLVADQNGREIFKDTVVTVPSYPYQILEMTPGPEVLTNLEISKEKTIGPKRRYRDMFGHWPKPRELTRAIEQKLISLDNGEALTANEEKLLGSDDILE